jgi:hypothetical protein
VFPTFVMRAVVHLRLPVLIVVSFIRNGCVILMSSSYLTKLEDNFDEESVPRAIL